VADLKEAGSPGRFIKARLRYSGGQSPDATKAGFNPWFVMLRILYCRRFEHAHGSDGGASSGGVSDEPVWCVPHGDPALGSAPYKPDQFCRQFNREFLTDVSPPFAHACWACPACAQPPRPQAPPSFGLFTSPSLGYRLHGPSKALSLGRTRGLYRRLVWLMDDDRPAERLMAVCLR
jgi:hypothetical protein